VHLKCLSLRQPYAELVTQGRNDQRKDHTGKVQDILDIYGRIKIHRKGLLMK
jgi:hypothetical protein